MVEDRGVIHYVIKLVDGQSQTGSADNRGKAREQAMQTLARWFVHPAAKAIYVEVRDG